MLKIALLTSSRADYSIYYPLITELKKDSFFLLDIIAFGNHNSLIYGASSSKIEEDGFTVKYKIDALVLGDSPESISDSMGLTMMKFSSVWRSENYNLIICLGDRFEMFAAVASSVPFSIPVAHISGGEITLGAIDNIFRNSLTLMSKLHFASTEQYKNEIIKIIGEERKNDVFNVGALSVDNLKNIDFLSIEEFKEKFNIDLTRKSILITFHPETVSYEKNEVFTDELIAALEELDSYQLIITMPNADTMGNMIRIKLKDFINSHANAIGIESFGTIGYLTCMKHCEFMLGNTSSGFVEAAFFPKFVINLGDRQKGRIETPNIYTTPVTKKDILNAVKSIETAPLPGNCNIYGDGNTSNKIVEVLKKYLSVFIIN
ncbi:UDP-N-acetylglucosamine 2-epimerase [Pedobacter sp.]|uniref:UDP-N-acetylglucosamine 2-epimerase n=1 Tax=Pedobacter sp. TaxID=1411316 RepID=UPI003BAD8772